MRVLLLMHDPIPFENHIKCVVVVTDTGITTINGCMKIFTICLCFTVKAFR